ncbi:Crp/Fnr family transcriptional regulator [Aneurinibacillus thermoaerophilus]|uniref:Crp/Fnr family transcriptional regulator n=1 Tax=Aneurinibacillus thermoaerophilus TaxID=143495 RepID=UPI002E1E0103|nr:Crp/Fnr family transcriptional regulator [Aneurinibacillus thermoaerophilus]MED0764328.1 Crp/Fnr family transcriptional regulator [Aneurinibacillus thermoaerophilus]
MKAQALCDFLGTVPLFASLTEQERKEIAGLMLHKRVKKRDILFYEGKSCTAIYLLKQGTVKVYKITEDGREQIVNVLHTGDMFPHVGVFGGGVYPATAEALEDASLYFINVKELTALLTGNPSLCLRLLQVLEAKILELQRRLSDVLSRDMKEKIINTLLSLARSKGKEEAGGYSLEMELTHQDLADMVGTTRETVSRIISQLKKDGFIEFNAHRIWIRHS